MATIIAALILVVGGAVLLLYIHSLHSYIRELEAECDETERELEWEAGAHSTALEEIARLKKEIENYRKEFN